MDFVYHVFVLNFLYLYCPLIVFGASIPLTDQSIYCEHYDEKQCDFFGECDVKLEECKPVQDIQPSCYALWSGDEEKIDIKLKMKGCFDDLRECNQSDCIASPNESKPKKNLYFCCCSGSMCNTDPRWAPINKPEVTVVPTPTIRIGLVLKMVIASVLFIILIIGTVFGISLYFRQKAEIFFFDSSTSSETKVASSSIRLIDCPLQLLELKSSGHYGEVWHAKLQLQDVCVKVFDAQKKDLWRTELYIYQLPRMRHHANILHILGYDKLCVKEVPTEYRLISDLHRNGTLFDYLKLHTITLPELYKITASILHGLHHLHKEFPASKSEALGHKPSIAHRNIKSKNILLKDDLTACIADFSLAMTFQESGKLQNEVTDDHTVGTYRYMAPEVLADDVIEFSCKAFLRIDIYSCSLVLWELITRCSVIGSCAVGSYQLPFEKELGKCPSLHELQQNVVKRKLRPHVAEAWRTHATLNEVCNIMEACWQHDPEQRLSAACILERFMEIAKECNKNDDNCNDV